jgi:hypothetical protein
MLGFLGGKASKRKVRLFAAACCRRIWHLLPDERSRAAVEVAERYVDKKAGEQTRHAASEAAVAATTPYYSGPGNVFTPLMAAAAAQETASKRRKLADSAAKFASSALLRGGAAAKQGESRAQSLLLRDVIGNPFRPVAFDRAWRTAAVASLAQAAYEERHLPAGTLDPLRLSVLADALEEAGANPAIVAHLRSDEPHVRGCWALDLALARS